MDLKAISNEEFQGVRQLSAEELAVISGGSMAEDLVSAANKALKTVGMVGGVIMATVMYLSLPKCD
jgi:hypothetical protein